MQYIKNAGDLEPTIENLIQEVPDLPPIPEHLLEYDLDVIESMENTFPYADWIDSVASYTVPQELHDWCQSHFDFPVSVKYLVVKKLLTPHIDHGIEGYKYSYVVDPGGEGIKTYFWDNSDKWEKSRIAKVNYTRPEEIDNIITSTICERNKWYRLYISEFHGVDKPERPRIFVTCKLADQKVDLSLSL